jgi:hypothetical protein
MAFFDELKDVENKIDSLQKDINNDSNISGVIKSIGKSPEKYVKIGNDNLKATMDTQKKD